MSREGRRMIMTYRGRPVFRMEPIRETRSSKEDLFYQLDRLADSRSKGLSNAEMDALIYEA
jgi:antitoxin (DNA-binding transcriptional repressor) of toxin-antitoxin stability system